MITLIAALRHIPSSQAGVIDHALGRGHEGNSQKPTLRKSAWWRRSVFSDGRRCAVRPRTEWRRRSGRFVNALRCIARVKKTPLAYEIWRNRGPGATISVGTQRVRPFVLGAKVSPWGVRDRCNG